MTKIKTSIPDYIAEQLGIKLNNSKQYRITREQLIYKNELIQKSKPNKRKLIETIVKKDRKGKVISSTEKLQAKPIEVPEHFEIIKVSTSKTTGQQWVQYAPKDPIEDMKDIDFESIIKNQVDKIKPIKIKETQIINNSNDFDVLTYTDLHIGMDTNSKNNSMYATLWNKDSIKSTALKMVNEVINNKTSNTLVVDELGDFLDGYNAKTTRGGHDLPQNLTNEDVFDLGLDFKMTILNGVIPYYENIIFNNICNDNHAGSFGYFVNSAFKQLAEKLYKNVNVENHLKFINHYSIGSNCFLISHGKDDSTLKFGFKPHLDTKQIEKIDHYIKHFNLYGKFDRFIFKKGDSHQLLFDYTGSSDFDYFNYMASSPPSQWVQTNFKNTVRGFTLENFKGIESTTKHIFL
tara:strand:- start:4049 stop:5263 length:1215 start_codon:yes stop_codon:yes gene_type:complete